MYDIAFKASFENTLKDEGKLIKSITYHDYSIEMHIHDFYEVNIVLSGRGCHRIEECTVPVKAGDVFVIPPDVAHSYNDCKGLDVFHLIIHPDFIKNNMAEARTVDGFTLLTEAEPFLRRNSPTPMFLQLSPGELDKIWHELEIISAKDEAYPYALITHTVWSLLYTFSHLLQQQLLAQKKQLSESCESAILLSLEYIHMHYAEKITIQNLCDEVFMSRSTFLRNFSELCRCTPLEYITAYRIKKAVQLMQDETWSKSEIAHECGFYDLSHMDRILRKHRASHFTI